MPNPSPSDQLHDFLDRAQNQARRLRRKYTNILKARRDAPDPEASPIRPTASMPMGAVFLHAGSLYQVIERGGGFDFGRPWNGAPDHKIALNPNSMLAKFYPVVETGEMLPEYSRKAQLLDHAGRTPCFVFESAVQADAIARLEATLAHRSGCRFREVSRTLSGLQDGACFFRFYSVGRPDPKDLSDQPLAGSGEVAVLPFEEGPYFWQWAGEARDA